MKVNEFETNMGIDVSFGIPEEFKEELPEQELLYDWDGGVLDEIKQNA